jgi:anti-sigma B factor antagonist
VREFTVEVDNSGAGDQVVLRPRGNLDGATTPILREHFDRLLEEKRYHVVIDLSETEYVSSVGIGLLLGSLTLFRRHGGDLALMHPSKATEKALSILNIRRYFRIVRAREGNPRPEKTPSG